MFRESVRVIESALRGKREKSYLVFVPFNDEGIFPIVAGHDGETPNVIDRLKYSGGDDWYKWTLTGGFSVLAGNLRSTSAASTAALTYSIGYKTAFSYCNIGTTDNDNSTFTCKVGDTLPISGSTYGPYSNGQSMADIPRSKYIEITISNNSSVLTIYSLRIQLEPMEFLDSLQDIGTYGAVLTGGLGVARGTMTSKLRNHDYAISDALGYYDLDGVKAAVALAPANGVPEDYSQIFGGTVNKLSPGEDCVVNIGELHFLHTLFDRYRASDFGMDSDTFLPAPFGDFSPIDYETISGPSLTDNKRVKLRFGKADFDSADVTSTDTWTFKWSESTTKFNVTNSAADSAGTLTLGTEYTATVDSQDYFSITVDMEESGMDSFLKDDDSFIIQTYGNTCRCGSVKIDDDDSIWALSTYPVGSIDDVAVNGVLQHTLNYTELVSNRYNGKQIATVQIDNAFEVGTIVSASAVYTDVTTFASGGGVEGNLTITTTSYTGDDISIDINVQAGDVTFQWKYNGGGSWEASDLSTAAGPVQLIDGVTVEFNGSQQSGDTWTAIVINYRGDSLEIKGAYNGSEIEAWQFESTSATQYKHRKDGDAWPTAVGFSTAWASLSDNLEYRFKDTSGFPTGATWDVTVDRIELDDITAVTWAGTGLQWKGATAENPGHVMAAYCDRYTNHDYEEIIDMSALADSIAFWGSLGLQYAGQLPDREMSYLQIVEELARLIGDVETTEGLMRVLPLRAGINTLDSASDGLSWRYMASIPRTVPTWKRENIISLRYGSFGNTSGLVVRRNEQSISEYGPQNGHLKAKETPVSLRYAKNPGTATSVCENWLDVRSDPPTRIMFEPLDQRFFRVQIGDTHIHVTAPGVPNPTDRSSGLANQPLRISGKRFNPTTGRIVLYGDIYDFNSAPDDIPIPDVDELIWDHVNRFWDVNIWGA